MPHHSGGEPSNGADPSWGDDLSETLIKAGQLKLEKNANFISLNCPLYNTNIQPINPPPVRIAAFGKNRFQSE